MQQDRQELLGLFYGGGLKALGVQALGAVSLIAWAVIVGSILFVVLKKAGLLRAKPQEEIEGLDSTDQVILHRHLYLKQTNQLRLYPKDRIHREH